MLQPINPPGSPIPGISQAVLIKGGQLLVLSGHVPMDGEGKVPGDLAAQTDLVFANLAATLKAAGVDFSAVARLTIYVKDFNAAMLPVIRSTRDKWINVACPPASALVGVAALFHPDVMIEIDALAVAPE